MSVMKSANLRTVWLGLVVLCVPLSTQASYKWTFSGGQCTAGCGSTYTSQKTFTTDPGGGPTVDVQGYGDTGASTSTGRTILKGEAGLFSGGLGVKNAGPDSGEGSDPEHAMDNETAYDSLRFDFSTAIELTKVAIGWYSVDSDISVLAYTASTAKAPDIAGKSYLDLISAGWELVSEISNVHNQPDDTATIADTAIIPVPTASSWLIAAFNPVFSGTSWTKYNDHVKVKLLEGNKPSTSVPEPSSILLLALVLLLLGLFRASGQRRGQRDGDYLLA